MSLRNRIVALERTYQNPIIDVVAILIDGRNRSARDKPHPYTPMTNEVRAQLQRTQKGRTLLGARKRVGGK
jgi:hypothetical protein